MGAGKTTYMFSINANVLSANFPFSVLPAGGVGMGQAAETESTLALAENIHVNLPTPNSNSSTLLVQTFFKIGELQTSNMKAKPKGKRVT